MKPLIIGHRGAAALEPENTLLSLARGLECGADLVEIDVRACKDDQLVVIHNGTLERTTSGKGPLRNFTLRELKSLDAGKGEKIPTLKEALGLIKRARAKLAIEIKEEGTEEAIVKEVSNASLEDSPLFVSFNSRSVRRTKELLPKAETGFIFSRPIRNPLGLATGLRARILLPRYDLVTTKLVDSAHERGIKVFSWTLNSKADFRRAIELGLDGFATDNPCLARQIIG